MLSDFLTLEVYFGQLEAAQYIEDATLKYGRKTLDKAVQCGDLIKKRITIGPDAGRDLVWLSPQGRQKIRSSGLLSSLA